jgi:hypothetical protein
MLGALSSTATNVDNLHHDDHQKKNDVLREGKYTYVSRRILMFQIEMVVAATRVESSKGGDSPPAHQKVKKNCSQHVAIVKKDVVHPPGVEPGPIAWKAIILPLDQECLMKKWDFMTTISYR